MPDPNQQYAYFSIVGDFDPADITARAGVTPSEAWRKGDTCPRTHRQRTFSRWKLLSRLDRIADLEDHIRDVLAQLDANPTPLIHLSHQYQGNMQLVGYFHADYPGLHFDSETTAALARYGLSVDFDFYGLYCHRREDTE